jgi:hypothetical protein
MGADSHTNYALRKNRRQEITPIHPELAEPLAEILDTTHGLIVYQEQVMAIAQKVAGFTLSQADNMRRAMGKKKKEILDAEFVPFSAGMQANGYSHAAITALWDTLVPFSDYAFNKAHTAAYGRPTSPPSSWRRCSPRWQTTKTKWRCISTSAAAWESRCCRRTSTNRQPTSPRSVPISASA